MAVPSRGCRWVKHSKTSLLEPCASTTHSLERRVPDDDTLNSLMRQTETLFHDLSEYDKTLYLVEDNSPQTPGVREAMRSVKTARRALLKAFRARQRGT